MNELYTEPGEAADRLNVCLDFSAIKLNNVSRVAVMGKRSSCASLNGLSDVEATKHRGNEMIDNIQLCILRSWH